MIMLKNLNDQALKNTFFFLMNQIQLLNYNSFRTKQLYDFLLLKSTKRKGIYTCYNLIPTIH